MNMHRFMSGVFFFGDWEPHKKEDENQNPKQTIKDLMEVREPFYLEVADVVVDTNRRNPKSVSNEIIKLIKNHQQSSGS